MKKKIMGYLLVLALVISNVFVVSAETLDNVETEQDVEQTVDSTVNETEEQIVEDTTEPIVEEIQEDKQEVENSDTNVENRENNENVENNENIENVENNENIENVENIDNIENVENNENVENIENVENTENSENVENVENIENIEDKETTENIENVENNENVENIENDDAIENVEETVEVENYVGRTEADIDATLLQDEHTIIKYVIDENATEGTVLNQYYEGEDLIIEVASAPVETEPFVSFNLLDTFELMADTTDAPTIEEGTWDDYPVSYEYNWDNSQSCWQWGEWKDGVCYKTEEGTYDNNVRHAMGMYCDGDNIHLHISFATIYSGVAQGDDYNFYVDGVGTKFRVVYADNGSGITGQYRQPGTYDIVAVNGDNWNSNYEANGSYGTIVIKENNLNNELEIVIPLETLQYQNSAVDTDNIMNIDFFTPNLMYRHISCGGASTGSKAGFGVMTSMIFCGVLLMYRKREYFQFSTAFCNG